MQGGRLQVRGKDWDWELSSYHPFAALELFTVVYTAAACFSPDSIHVRPSASLQLTATFELRLLIHRAGQCAGFIAADNVAGRFAGHIAGQSAGCIAGSLLVRQSKFRLDCQMQQHES
jgi:hypothetical protein